MVQINPQKIEGKWRAGFALDFHTVGRLPVGYNERGYMPDGVTRTPIGQLLFQLKYRGDQAAAPDIITTAADYLRPRLRLSDMLVPVPPSTPRAIQPVEVLAAGIGAAVGLPVVPCITITRSSLPLKNIEDPDMRTKELEGLYAVEPRHTAGRQILLFDDVFRSGSTLNAITDVLLRHGKAKSVSVLTITRTRSMA